jgi:hypothetical protein
MTGLAMVGFLVIFLGGICGAGTYTIEGRGISCLIRTMFAGGNTLVTFGFLMLLGAFVAHCAGVS